MKFHFKKITKENEVREHEFAPSFLTLGVTEFQVHNQEEIKSLITDNRNPVVLVSFENFPDNPRSFAKAFTDAFYVVISGDPEAKELKKINLELEKIIFSPVVKVLSGSIVIKDFKEAEKLVSSFIDNGRKVIGIRVK